MTEDPATGPTGDGLAQPPLSAAGWPAAAESVDDRDGTPFAPGGEDTVRLARSGQQPTPQEHDAPTVRSRPGPAPEAVAPEAAAPAQPQVPLAPAKLTFPAQDVQQPAAAGQQPAQPQYQPQTPYQPQPYLQTLQPQQAQPPVQQQPVQPTQPQPPYQTQPYTQAQPPVQQQPGQQPFPVAPGYQPQPVQQPAYVQPPVYVQPSVYGQAVMPPVAYGQPGYPQPAVFGQPAVFAQPPVALQPPVGAQPASPPQGALAGPPGMLAAAADRERAIDVLKAAYGEGRITKDEFDYRVNQVAQARTYADLGVVIADLPAGPLGGVSHYPGGLPAQAPYYPPARQTTNGLAVGSLVCALLGISLPAVIMGHVARRQIRDRNEGGDGLAIAGLVIGWLGMAFYALMFIAAIVAAGSGGS